MRTLAAVCMLVLLGSCSGSRTSHEKVTSPRSNSARACPSSTVLVLGACVAPDIAEAVCGPSSLALAGGCAPRPPCKSGEARDATGACIAAARVRSFAEENGIFLGEEDDIGCEGGEELVLRDASGHLACSVPPSAIRACPIGSVGDEAACVRVKDGEMFDAALWLRTVVGPSGGKGAPPICRVLDGETGDTEIEVALRFTDNDVSQLELRAQPAAAEVALRPFANAARGLGGAARTSEAATRVRCKAASNGRPKAQPR